MTFCWFPRGRCVIIYSHIHLADLGYLCVRYWAATEGEEKKKTQSKAPRSSFLVSITFFSFLFVWFIGFSSPVPNMLLTLLSSNFSCDCGTTISFPCPLPVLPSFFFFPSHSASLRVIPHSLSPLPHLLFMYQFSAIWPQPHHPMESSLPMAFVLPNLMVIFLPLSFWTTLLQFSLSISSFKLYVLDFDQLLTPGYATSSCFL